MSSGDSFDSASGPAPADGLIDFASRLRMRPRNEWVDEVRRDQAHRWRTGGAAALEDYFNCLPELTENEEDTLVLIMGELLLRRKMDREGSLSEYQRRFPRLATQLSVQFELDRLWTSVGERPDLPMAACPVCHNEIKQAADSLSSGLVCPSCGCRFRVQREVGTDWHSCEATGKLGKYELLEAVGVGAFGTVFKAHDSELGRTVAIKLPRASNVATREDLERFVREARCVAQLRHPSIVPVYEIGQSDKMPFLVSEFVEGSTLADVLLSRRPAPREAADLLATVADSLHYAHQMGVVHRDVKPANIMLDELNRPRLMDFGLARRESADVTMTVDGQILGTPAYMSPEQARGESRKVDGRSDVYSLGVILYQLLTGELPFRGTTQSMLHQVLHEEPRRPRSVNYSVPRDLETICLRAMAKEAGQRYASARELADDLRRFLRNEPIQARPFSAGERVWRWCRRKPAVAGLTAAVVTLLVAIATGGTIAAFQFRRQAGIAEDLVYFQNIELANRELTASIPHPARAVTRLQNCLPERRGWEWNYLNRLWRTEAIVLRVPDCKGFNSVSFSPDGTQMAAACSNGRVAVWNLSTYDVTSFQAHNAEVYSVAFSPRDSHRLASAGADGKVRLWDMATNRQLLEVPGRAAHAHGSSQCVTFSPDGRLLAAASEGGTVGVWDSTTGRRIHELAGHEFRASCVAFSRDGHLLASGSWRGVVRIWNATTGHCEHELRGEGVYPVGGLTFSPDGKHLVAGYFDRHIDVWNVDNGRFVHNFPGHTGLVLALAFHPGERHMRMASASEDRTVKIWDPYTGQEVLILRGHTDRCCGLAFSRDGQRLASASSDGTIRLWDARPMSDKQPQQPDTLTLGHEVWSVAINRDGSLVAAAGLGKNVRVWDTSSRRQRLSFPGIVDMVFNLAFSPDGQYLVLAGLDNGKPACVLKLLDLTSRRILEYRQSDEIYACAVSPDGKWVSFGTAKGWIKLADTKTLKNIIPIGKHEGDVAQRALHFRDDGLRLASASTDGSVGLWDLASALNAASAAGASTNEALWEAAARRRPLQSFDRPGIACWSVAFSRDGGRLITGSKDGQLTLWDAESGQPLNSVRPATSGEFLSVAFGPDREWIASASEDCTVRVLDATTLEPLDTYRGHLGPIRCLAISSSGKLLATGSHDNTVKLWSLEDLRKALNK